MYELWNNLGYCPSVLGSNSYPLSIPLSSYCSPPSTPFKTCIFFTSGIHNVAHELRDHGTTRATLSHTVAGSGKLLGIVNAELYPLRGDPRTGSRVSIKI